MKNPNEKNIYETAACKYENITEQEFLTIMQAKEAASRTSRIRIILKNEHEEWYGFKDKEHKIPRCVIYKFPCYYVNPDVAIENDNMIDITEFMAFGDYKIYIDLNDMSTQGFSRFITDKIYDQLSMLNSLEDDEFNRNGSLEFMKTIIAFYNKYKDYFQYTGFKKITLYSIIVNNTRKYFISELPNVVDEYVTHYDRTAEHTVLFIRDQLDKPNSKKDVNMLDCWRVYLQLLINDVNHDIVYGCPLDEIWKNADSGKYLSKYLDFIYENAATIANRKEESVCFKITVNPNYTLHLAFDEEDEEPDNEDNSGIHIRNIGDVYAISHRNETKEESDED